MYIECLGTQEWILFASIILGTFFYHTYLRNLWWGQEENHEPSTEEDREYGNKYCHEEWIPRRSNLLCITWAPSAVIFVKGGMSTYSYLQWGSGFKDSSPDSWYPQSALSQDHNICKLMRQESEMQSRSQKQTVMTTGDNVVESLQELRKLSIRL